MEVVDARDVPDWELAAVGIFGRPREASAVIFQQIHSGTTPLTCVVGQFAPRRGVLEQGQHVELIL